MRQYNQVQECNVLHLYKLRCILHSGLETEELTEHGFGDAVAFGLRVLD